MGAVLLVPGLLLGIALLGAATASAADRERGKALYENQCESCHSDWTHTRTKRKVRSLEELRGRVVGWSVHAGLGWTREEIDDVVAYLNEEFYKFR